MKPNPVLAMYRSTTPDGHMDGGTCTAPDFTDALLFILKAFREWDGNGTFEYKIKGQSTGWVEVEVK